MYVKEVTVENQVGLHARPATFFIQKANEFKSSIWVEKEERRVNAKSLLGVLSLGIVGGTTIRIIADGADEQAAVGRPGQAGQLRLCRVIYSRTISGGATRRFFCIGKATPHDKKLNFIKKACMLPLLPGVYIIRDKSDTIIYIGKAKRLRIRVSQYFREGVPHDNKVSQMIAHAYAFDVIVCQSEFEALVLEASQIKAHTPKYNILLKDDKGYSYIKVTKEPWPRLSFVLQKEEDDAEYIGPYYLQLCRRGRWQKPPWMPFCCQGAISASRRRSAKDAPA